MRFRKTTHGMEIVALGLRSSTLATCVQEEVNRYREPARFAALD